MRLRIYGNQHGRWIKWEPTLESCVREACRELGLDPEEVRRRAVQIHNREVSQ